MLNVIGLYPATFMTAQIYIRKQLNRAEINEGMAVPTITFVYIILKGPISSLNN